MTNITQNNANSAAKYNHGDFIKIKTKSFYCNGIVSDENNTEILYSPHPKVYLKFGHDNAIICPYCATKYICEGEFEEK